jgi:hypothetical protein
MLSFKFQITSFNIINIYIIILGSQTKEFFYPNLIYYLIKIYIYKY